MSSIKSTTPVVGVCATCPWRVCNQGKRHPSHWYTIKNLRRLWNGIRNGENPGMVCHSTDPESIEYGGTKPVPQSAKTQECGGLLILVFRHFDALGMLNQKQYKAAYPKTYLKTLGIATWLERKISVAFGAKPVPEVAFTGKPDEIGHPDERV